MSYDFNKREEFEYSHSFDYFGGVGLGKHAVDAVRDKELKRGTYDITPVAPPANLNERDDIIRIATLVHDSRNRESLLSKIRQQKDTRMAFVWDETHEYHPYYVWALHCIDREVKNWTQIIAASARPRSRTEAPADTPAVHKQFNVNDWVDISGIQARPELNGKKGRVSSVDPTTRRLLIEFPDILQTVSISESKCQPSSASGIASSQSHLPQGLRVEIKNLTSEQGKKLNGAEAFIVSYNKVTERYTVRLNDASNELKSLKADNLHACLPPGWTEQVDQSTGETFYREIASDRVTWSHPVLGGANKADKRKTASQSEFVGEASNDDSTSEPEDDAGPSSFKRGEFLDQERKRLRLDKKRQAGEASEANLRETLQLIRSKFSLFPLDTREPLYIGTAKTLLDAILAASSEQEQIRLLYIALEVICQDLRKLKFNKRQLVGFLEHLDQILEEESFSEPIKEWIIGGLKLAAPISYSIH